MGEIIKFECPYCGAENVADYLGPTTRLYICGSVGIVQNACKKVFMIRTEIKYTAKTFKIEGEEKS